MMAALGALLSAFFWIPIAVDRQWIRTEYFLQVDYRDEFVGLAQLLTTTIEHNLTPELGIPLVIAASCGLLAVGLSDRTRRTRRLITVAGLLSLSYIFMMNHRSGFLWSNIGCAAVHPTSLAAPGTDHFPPQPDGGGSPGGNRLPLVAVGSGDHLSSPRSPAS